MKILVLDLGQPDPVKKQKEKDSGQGVSFMGVMLRRHPTSCIGALESCVEYLTFVINNVSESCRAWGNGGSYTNQGHYHSWHISILGIICKLVKESLVLAKIYN